MLWPVILETPILSEIYQNVKTHVLWKMSFLHSLESQVHFINLINFWFCERKMVSLRLIRLKLVIWDYKKTYPRPGMVVKGLTMAAGCDRYIMIRLFDKHGGPAQCAWPAINIYDWLKPTSDWRMPIIGGDIILEKSPTYF